MKYSGTDVALLLVRVGLSAVFISHGLDNIYSTIYFLGSLELLASLAMLIGIGASWAGIIMAADMLGSVTLAKVSHGFGGWELELVLFLSSLAIAFAGAGKFKALRSSPASSPEPQQRA